MPVSNVSCVISLVPGGRGRLRVEVHVQSYKDPKINASGFVDPGAATGGPQHLSVMIGSTGGACAEWLNEHYGESHNPTECAKAAIDEFRRECQLMAELKQGTPEKLKTLIRGPLLPIDRERVDRMKYKVDRGLHLVREELYLINRLLAARSRGLRR